MGVRRPGATRGYEEMQGTNMPVSPAAAHLGSTVINGNGNDVMGQAPTHDLELASVSVVPDGTKFV